MSNKKPLRNRSGDSLGREALQYPTLRHAYLVPLGTLNFNLAASTPSCV